MTRSGVTQSLADRQPVVNRNPCALCGCDSAPARVMLGRLFFPREANSMPTRLGTTVATCARDANSMPTAIGTTLASCARLFLSRVLTPVSFARSNNHANSIVNFVDAIVVEDDAISRELLRLCYSNDYVVAPPYGLAYG